MIARIFYLITIILLIVFSSIYLQDSATADEMTDIEQFKDKAEFEKENENPGYAGLLYSNIATFYKEDKDWDNAVKYFKESAECYVTAEKFEYAAKSYSNAGDCYKENENKDHALEYYEKAKNLTTEYKDSEPDYDDSWLDENINALEADDSSVQKIGIVLLVIGIALALIKFSAKAALGSSYASLNKKQILSVASIYLGIGLISGMIMLLLGSSFVSNKIIETIFNYGVVFGIFQVAIATLLIYSGFFTIHKWKQGEDVTRKTFLTMVIPCPVSVATILISSSFLVITGINPLLAGFIVGGIFFVSIMGISIILKTFIQKPNPATLGTIMILFSMMYVFTIIFIPSYLIAANREITVTFSSGNLFPVYLSIIIIILMSFIFTRINIDENIIKIRGEG